jgi:hypothetical protein
MSQLVKENIQRAMTRVFFSRVDEVHETSNSENTMNTKQGQ